MPLTWQDIRTACISPDATALALGTEGGLVKFYILEVMEEVRCAHEWPPHASDDDAAPRPVDSLLFLDNLHAAQSGTQSAHPPKPSSSLSTRRSTAGSSFGSLPSRRAAETGSSSSGTARFAQPRRERAL